MKTEKKTDKLADKKFDYLTRDSILKLLDENELSSVADVESEMFLKVGDEYIDLGQLDHGVRKAITTTTSTRNVLPRSAVYEETWTRIVEHMASRAIATAGHS